jgi:hypothetical protein
MSFGGRGRGKGDYPFARVKPVSGLISPPSPQEYLPLTEKVSLHLSYYRIIPNTLTFLDLTGPTHQPCSLHLFCPFNCTVTFAQNFQQYRSFTYIQCFQNDPQKQTKHVSPPESSVVNQDSYVFGVSRIRIR